jgi:hypothetical protein
MTYSENEQLRLLLVVGKYDYHELVQLLEECSVRDLDNYTIVFVDVDDKSNVSLVVTSHNLIDCIRPQGSIGLIGLAAKLKNEVELLDKLNAWLIDQLLVY